ncbi:MAG: FtsQ-type POTRA domain-containing protein [Treponema sp.]|nr:FtsQ-type POTRA domain-containing protein [Treponema sp.]
MSDIGLLLNEDFKFESGDTVSAENFSGKADKNDKKIKIIIITFIVLCILLIGELVVYKYMLPSFASPRVTVSGEKIYTPEEIASKLIPMNCSTWFDFNVEQAVSLISSEPGIDRVTVEKKFPDKIYIDVVERQPVAVTCVVENGFSYPMQIDKNGVLFPLKDSSVLTSKVIPVISGLPIEQMSGGMKIPSKYKTLIEQIANISTKNKNYFASIAEICVIPKEFGNYELALIPAQSKIRVLTDRSLNEDALKYMMVLLDVVNLLDTEVTEVDLRYGSFSCKIKDQGGVIGDE